MACRASASPWRAIPPAAPRRAAAPAARAATTPKATSSPAAVRGRDGQRQGGRAPVLEPAGIDDRRVRDELAHVSSHGGRALIVAAPIREVSRFSALIRGVQVLQSPTVLVVDHSRRRARSSASRTGPRSASRSTTPSPARSPRAAPTGSAADVRPPIIARSWLGTVTPDERARVPVRRRYALALIAAPRLPSRSFRAAPICAQRCPRPPRSSARTLHPCGDPTSPPRPPPGPRPGAAAARGAVPVGARSREPRAAQHGRSRHVPVGGADRAQRRDLRARGLPLGLTSSAAGAGSAGARRTRWWARPHGTD